MTAFEQLQSVTEAAQNEQELPDYLAERIFRIIENQERFHAKEAEIDNLSEQVTNYDTYGQTGYLGMGVNNVILEKALNRLEEKYLCLEIKTKKPFTQYPLHALQRRKIHWRS